MKHISFISSGYVFTVGTIVFLAGLWWVWNAIPWFIPIIGAWLLVCASGFITFSFVSKARAMWRLDYEGTGNKPQRRVRSGTKD